MGTMSPPSEPLQELVFSCTENLLALCYGDCRPSLVFSSKTWLPVMEGETGTLMCAGLSGTLLLQQGNVYAQADPSAALVCLSDLPAVAGQRPATALSPDGTFLAVQDRGCRVVRVFDIRSQQAVSMLILPKLRLPEHGSMFYPSKPSLLLAWAASGLSLTVTRTWATCCEADHLALIEAVMSNIIANNPPPADLMAESASVLQQAHALPSSARIRSKKAFKVFQIVEFSFA